MRRFWWAGTVCLVLTGSALGELLYPLRADLSDPAPFEFGGVLAPVPNVGDRTVRLGIPDATPSGGAKLLEAKRVALRTQEWVEGPLDRVSAEYIGPPLPGDPPEVQGEYREATLRLERVRFRAEVLTVEYPWDWKGDPRGGGDANATGAQCDLHLAVADERSRFPGDPERAAPDQGVMPPDNKGQLHATCDVAAFTYAAPQYSYWYGLDLLLESSDLDGPIRIQTGTFEETRNGVATGNRVTRILIASDVDGSHRLDLPFAVHADLWAASMWGLGRLQLPPAEGRREWGSVLTEGSLSAFDAEGEFWMRANTTVAVNVEGSTFDAPDGRSLSLFGPDLASGLLVSAAAALLLGALLRAAWLLFTKLAPERVVNHPRRARILEIVSANPGIETQSVARSLGLGWGLALYHVSTLQRAGHLKLHRVGGRTALFIPNVGHRGREDALALLRRDAHRRVHELLLARPGQAQRELAEALGVTQARISQILSQLSSAGLVESRDEAGGRRYLARPVA